jgi:hypothetical protein
MNFSRFVILVLLVIGCLATVIDIGNVECTSVSSKSKSSSKHDHKNKDDSDDDDDDDDSDGKCWGHFFFMFYI